MESDYCFPFFILLSLFMIFKNRWHMMKASWFQIFSGIGIISFLLFFWNLLLLVSHQVAVSGDNIQQKLGVYFYLSDSWSSKDEVYSHTIEMMDVLKKAGLEVNFYSKKDAFDVLSKKLPNVIGSLEQYGIQNPLPPTLYVLFDNQKEYESMKKIVWKYKDIILNFDDALWTLSFTAQQERVAQVINMMNSLQYLVYFLIFMVIVIIIAFLIYAIRLNFFRFQKQIEVEKLLWTKYSYIMSPFIVYVISILCASFLLTWWYLFILFSRLDLYFKKVFSTSVYEILPAKTILFQRVGGEIAFLIILSIIFSWLFLWSLLKKI